MFFVLFPILSPLGEGQDIKLNKHTINSCYNASPGAIENVMAWTNSERWGKARPLASKVLKQKFLEDSYILVINHVTKKYNIQYYPSWTNLFVHWTMAKLLSWSTEQFDFYPFSDFLDDYFEEKLLIQH